MQLCCSVIKSCCCNTKGCVISTLHEVLLFKFFFFVCLFLVMIKLVGILKIEKGHGSFCKEFRACSSEGCYKTDSKKNKGAHFIYVFVVSYSVMSVCLEEQRNAHRYLRGDPGKANLIKGEICRMAKAALQKGSGNPFWSQEPFGKGERLSTQEASAKQLLAMLRYRTRQAGGRWVVKVRAKCVKWTAKGKENLWRMVLEVFVA